MPRIIATTPTGDSLAIDAPSGQALMVALRDSGEGMVDEQFGLCGGCCTCYTCHVWISPEFLPALPPRSAQEDDLLALATHRRPNSRLACQIPLTEALDGLALSLPPID